MTTPRKTAMKRGHWLFPKNDEGPRWFSGDEGPRWFSGAGVFDGGLEGLEAIEVLSAEHVLHSEYLNPCDRNRQGYTVRVFVRNEVQ